MLPSAGRVERIPLRKLRPRGSETMPMFFYLPLIIARGMLSLGAETLERSEATRLSHARLPAPQRRPSTAPPTQPGFDQPWLAASHPERR